MGLSRSQIAALASQANARLVVLHRKINEKEEPELKEDIESIVEYLGKVIEKATAPR